MAVQTNFLKLIKGMETDEWDHELLLNANWDRLEGILNGSIINVQEFGAVGDGVNDDSVSIQAAVQDAITRGGIVYFPKPAVSYNTGSYIVPDTVAQLHASGQLNQSTDSFLKLGRKRPTNPKSGTMYWDETDKCLYVYDGTAWIRFLRKNGSDTISGDLTVTGNLTVQGDQVILNTSVLEVEDNFVVLNRGVTGAPTLDAGIEIERGTAQNARFYFDETNNVWMIDNGEGVVSRVSHSDLVNVKDFGVKGDGSTDDTSNLQVAFSRASSLNTGVHFPSGVYNVTKVVVPSDLIVLFDKVVLKRVGGTGRLVEIGSNTKIYGHLTIDGNKNNYPGTKSEGGISFGNNSTSFGFLGSYNNSGHGVVVSGVAGVTLYDVTSNNNGNNPDVNGTGTGDGICVTNAVDITIKKCVCNSNSRIGLTLTTYNANTTALDNTLSKNIVVLQAICTGNAYLDYDFEGVSLVKSSRLYGARCSVSNSRNITITDSDLEYLYGSLVENIFVQRLEMRPTGSVSNVLFLDGKSINVKSVRVYDTASTYTSNTVELNTSDNSTTVESLLVEKGNNAIKLTGVSSMRDIKVLSALNIPIQVNSRRPPTVYQTSLSFEGGVLLGRNNKQPGTGQGYDTGTNSVGDTVYNVQPSYGSPTGWVCTVAGTPGTWEPLGFVGGQEKQTSLPSASSSQRGRIVRIEGATGVADAVYVCVKKADDTFDWAQLF